MSPPLALTVPAAAAGLAYLNARFQVFYDLLLLRSVIPSTIKSRYREYFDRLNQFYVLEALGTGKYRDRPFILFEDKQYTFAETYELALKYGAWFSQTKGVKPKDIVAIDFQNSDHFVFFLFGLWSIGAKPAFMNYNLSGHALAHCVKAATTKLMVVDPHVADHVTEELKEDVSDVEIQIFSPELEREVLAMEPTRASDSARSEDLEQNMAILIYTSGTTGLPKPAIVSWAKCTVGGTFSGELLKYGKEDVFYTCMPLYHSSACILGLLNSLEHGSAFAIGRKFSTKTFWQDVRKHNATIIQYVGETCRYLLAAPPQIQDGVNLDRQHKVRVAFGNGLRPDVWNKFKTRFGIDSIAEFYASTEGSFGTWNLSNNDFALGAVGRNGTLYDIIMGHNVAVVEVDFETDLPRRDEKSGGFCKKVVPGEPGEMLFNLPAEQIESRFQGYYGNRKATSDKIMRDVFKTGDAWFRTGDVVRWDRDGRLFFSDRIGDTFRWKSENVSTAEVAEAVGRHPQVKGANVYGVELPHHDGRAGCVALLLTGDAVGEGERRLMESLAEHVRRTLPKFAVPLFLRVLGEEGMRTTGTNKLLKQHLREEGVDPGLVVGDGLFWLRGGAYRPFGRREWDELCGGRVKL